MEQVAATLLKLIAKSAELLLGGALTLYLLLQLAHLTLLFLYALLLLLFLDAIALVLTLLNHLLELLLLTTALTHIDATKLVEVLLTLLADTLDLLLLVRVELFESCTCRLRHLSLAGAILGLLEHHIVSSLELLELLELIVKGPLQGLLLLGHLLMHVLLGRLLLFAERLESVRLVSIKIREHVLDGTLRHDLAHVLSLLLKLILLELLNGRVLLLDGSLLEPVSECLLLERKLILELFQLLGLVTLQLVHVLQQLVLELIGVDLLS